MHLRTLRGASAVLVLLLSSSLFAQQRPWDAPAFSSEPKALVAAAEQVSAGDFAVVMLLDEASYVVDAGGGVKSRERVMLRVVSEAGVSWASEVRAPWAPWSSDKPTIEARVIARDGSVHPLDQAAVVEVPAGEEGDIFSDGRVLRAPLPAVAEGSVVEYVVSRTSRDPIPGAGSAIYYYFGGYLPTERTRVTIDAPAGFETHVVNKTGLEPRVEERDGRRRSVYECARIEGQREFDDDVPYDVAVRRYLGFSTGTSWQDIATKYAAIVDRQIDGNDLQKLVRAAIGTTTVRNDIVTKLLAAIQKDVRYAGVEIGEGSIVPRAPRQVLANKYGDCKDKAALLVAMLRTAGVPAHVALLAAGEGFDVVQELPGLGNFNHAIVVVEPSGSDGALWVDPTDVFARPGELPWPDQGRMALIAKPETTALTATPETPSSANVYREVRTFVLPEDGKARVTEVTEPGAMFESSLRRWISSLDSKKLRDNLEEYAKAAYVAKSITRYDTTPVNDLTRPLRLTIEVPESGSGVVGDGNGDVAINVTSLPSHVPSSLRDWKEVQPGEENAEDAPKKRTHEFLFPQPGVREWVYRIVPPSGYVPRTLPANETKQIGTTTFTQELHTEPDNTVVATFRFDTGKRRLTRDEFQETRVAFTKFVTSNTVNIGFDQIGQARLNAGDVRGALEEFRRLAALHPKEAQHHIEISRALLAGGLGDAARDEIRRGLAIEPKNARAHQMLGSILLNDSLGRPYRRGFDLPGAVAAFRKAKELDPKSYAIRNALIIALEYGDDGYRFSRGAHLQDAVDEVLAMAKDLGDEGKPMLPELTLLYAHMGRFDDLRKLAPTLDDVTQRDLARIIATAALDGTDAAVRELSAFDPQKKRSYASSVGGMLIQLRRYPEGAALLDLATQGTPAAAEQRQSIDLFKRVKRVEDLPKDDKPGNLLRNVMLALLHQDLDEVKSMMPAEYVAKSETSAEEFEKMDLRVPEGFTPAVFGDLLSMAMETQEDDDGSGGYRVRARMLGVDTADAMYVFTRKENGRWVALGGANGSEMTGYAVLSMVTKGELAPAQQWLNWTREEVKAGSSDDPLEGSPFAALWPKAKASATADEIRLAAAALATKDFTSKTSEPILLDARERIESAQAKAAIDVALAKIYEDRKDWPRMLDVTTRLVASHPDSPTAFSKHALALLENGKGAEMTALAKQRLARIPNDPDAVRALSMSAAAAGDYAAAQQYATKIVDELRPKREDYARLAWTAVFTGQELERAIERAQRASKEKGDKDDKGTFAVNALAALYAEAGKSVEARAALLESIDYGRGPMNDADWYVLGRIAENYGVDDYAITAYRKVSKDGGVLAVSQLAQRRLDALVKPKK